MRGRGIAPRWNLRGFYGIPPRSALGASRPRAEGAQISEPAQRGPGEGAHRPRLGSLSPRTPRPGSWQRLAGFRGRGKAQRPRSRGTGKPGLRRRDPGPRGQGGEGRGPHLGFAEPRGLSFPVSGPGGDPRRPPGKSARSHEAQCAEGAASVSQGCRERAGGRDGRWSWGQGRAGLGQLLWRTPPGGEGFPGPANRLGRVPKSRAARTTSERVRSVLGSGPGPGVWESPGCALPAQAPRRGAAGPPPGRAGRAHGARHAASGWEEGGRVGAARSGAVLSGLLLLGLLLLAFLRLSRRAAQRILLPPWGARGYV